MEGDIKPFEELPEEIRTRLVKRDEDDAPTFVIDEDDDGRRWYCRKSLGSWSGEDGGKVGEPEPPAAVDGWDADPADTIGEVEYDFSTSEPQSISVVHEPDGKITGTFDLHPIYQPDKPQIGAPVPGAKVLASTGYTSASIEMDQIVSDVIGRLGVPYVADMEHSIDMTVDPSSPLAAELEQAALNGESVTVDFPDMQVSFCPTEIEKNFHPGCLPETTIRGRVI